MMNIDILPKEVRENEDIIEALNKLENSFYGYFVHTGNILASSIDMTTELSKAVYLRIMAGNIVKSAFDGAYSRYLTHGVFDKEGINNE